MKERPARLLVIAGSDSSGGAGIQADIKTATALGAYAMAAVTAVTAQDTRGIYAIHPIPASVVREQIAWTLADIGADAIKIGMLGSVEIVDAVADVLSAKAQGIPLILDPVLASSSGTALSDDAALAAIKTRLLPLAAIVSPNIPEAELFCGFAVQTPEDAKRAGQSLRALGAQAALITGGHAAGATVTDLLVTEAGAEEFSSRRILTKNTHGTGCTLATAIAVGLGQGRSLHDAVERAHYFVHQAILTAPGFGSGNGPLNHMHGMSSPGD